MQVDPRTHTKNGKLREGRPTITARRLELRKYGWEKVKVELQQHLATFPRGEASRIGRQVGAVSSQIHRYACQECEHDQEPSFTTGLAILLYIAQLRCSPMMEAEIVSIELVNHRPYRPHRTNWRNWRPW